MRRRNRRNCPVVNGLVSGLFILALTVSCAVAGTPARPAGLLRDSRDGQKLKNAAITLAASSSPDDHRLLLGYLSSGDFLGRLDPPEHYQGTYRNLRLGRVLQTLADNRCASSDGVLLGLIDSADFQGHVLRKQLLLRALVVVRPSPPSAVAYWDRLSGPSSAISGDVIDALCENQSAPALELLERKFSDPSEKATKKVLWMRKYILPRRNDEPLLLACERMVTRSLPPDLRPALVEALFDYRRDEWFRSEMPPEPPPRAKVSPGARKVLERIGRYALKNLKLTREQKAAVRTALAEFGK